MDYLSPDLRNELISDTSAVNEALSAGISPGRRSMAASYAQRWYSFCQQHQLDPYLSTCPDPVAWLQIFALRVRDGRFSASGNAVRSSTVADALHAVAQTFTSVGRPDPRWAAGSNTTDTRLTRLLRSFAKLDAPPTRVKPLPLALLHLATNIALQANDVASLAASDLMWLAFFFLLRPGEYSNAGPSSHPFRIADIQLWHNTSQLDPLTSDESLLLQATFVTLTFDTQKNGTRNERIGHGCTPHVHSCPVRSVVRRILYLRQHHATADTHLCCCGPQLQPLPTTVITNLLRQAGLTSPSTSLAIADITAKALRATGATALLNENIVGDKIKLLGRWKSDAMLRYLHLQAHHLMQDYSTIMLNGGDYTLLPSPPPDTR